MFISKASLLAIFTFCEKPFQVVKNEEPGKGNNPAPLNLPTKSLCPQ